MRKGLRELMKQLPGWEAAPTTRRIRLVHKTGATVIVSSTPSDGRAQRNMIADCRRRLKVPRTHNAIKEP